MSASPVPLAGSLAGSLPGLLAGLLTLVLLTSCGDATPAGGSSDDGPGASGGAGVLDRLAGRTFLSLPGGDGPGPALVPGSAVRLDFRDGSIGASAGCNSMGGDVSADGDRLVVGVLSMTEMACDTPLMEQDEWLAQFLSSGPTAQLSGATLTLTSDETRLVLSEEQPSPLAGTLWELDTVLIGPGPDGAASTPPLGARASLRLVGTRLEVRTGCNMGSADVVVEDDVLRVGPLALTKRGCTRELAELEAMFVRVLQGTASYEIDGQRLTVTAEDGSTGLSFRAE